MSLILFFIIFAFFLSVFYASVLFFYTKFSPLYFSLLSVHLCLISIAIRVYKIRNLMRLSSISAADGMTTIAHLVDPDYHRLVTMASNRYLDGNESWANDETLSWNIALMKDVAREVNLESFDVLLSYWIGTVISVLNGLFVILPALNSLRKRAKFESAHLMYNAVHSCHSRIPLIFLVPFFTVWSNLVVFLYWRTMARYLFLPDQAVVTSEGIVTREYSQSAQIYFFRALLFISILWLSEVFHAVEVHTIAGCICDWFFHKRRSGLNWTYLPVRSQLYKIITRNLGQIAVGSCLVRLSMPFRMIFRLCESLSLRGSTNNRALSWKQVIQMYNRKAYISVVIFDDDYFTACKRTSDLTTTHAPHAAKTIRAMNCYITLARVSVVMATLVLLLMVWGTSWYDDEHQALPLIILTIVTWSVAKTVLSVQSVTMDTLMMCHCVDKDTNNGRDLPYISPKILQVFCLKIKHLVILNCFISIS